MNPSYRHLPGIHASPNIQTAPDVYEVENRAADPEQRVEQAIQAIAAWTGKTVIAPTRRPATGFLSTGPLKTTERQ